MAAAEGVMRTPKKTNYFVRLGRDIRMNKMLYLLLLPPVVYFFIFRYMPMYGLQIAFQEYSPLEGFGVNWVGFRQFRLFMNNPWFFRILRNTITISMYKISIGGIAPVILALMLNEIGARKFRRVVQTVSYLPHFLSWVIVYGVFFFVLNENVGVLNNLREYFGLGRLAILSNKSYFYQFIVGSSVWKGIGYGSIIYLAAISSIPQELYESAVIDGANRWQQMVNITLPSLYQIFAIMIILQLGNILSEDFTQLFMFMGGVEQLHMTDVGEVFETYIFRMGFLGTQYQGPMYSYSAAVGFFKSAFGMILVVSANSFAKKRLNYRGVF